MGFGKPVEIGDNVIDEGAAFVTIAVGMPTRSMAKINTAHATPRRIRLSFMSGLGDAPDGS
jgi:hypothetical protein